MSNLIQCPNCGNTDFEEENGLLVCTSCGRQQDAPLLTEQDDADFGIQGKVVRKKVEKSKVKVTTIYRGAKAYRLYLQAWQHIMWQQAYTLIHGSAKLPPQTWTVARDIWTLWLSRLLARQVDTDGQKPPADTDDDLTELSEGDPEALVARKRKGLEPGLWDTIALVYIAALLVQGPITLVQVYQLVRSEELPFIRAIRHVPIEMSSKLPSEYREALDTTTIPQPHHLQNAVQRNLQRFHNGYGIGTPTLNWHIVLFNWIEQLALPVEVYAGVKRLNKIVGYDFTYHIAERSLEAVDNGRLRQRRRSPVDSTEMQLISLLLVTTKLLFPFNKHAVGHAEIRLDWSVWLRVHKSLDAEEHPRRGLYEQIEVKDRDIMGFNAEQMDRYMDWYQNMFPGSEESSASKKNDLEKSILDMFPLLNVGEQSTTTPGLHQEAPAGNERVRRVAAEAIIPAIARNYDDNEEAAASQLPGSEYSTFPALAALEASTDHEDEVKEADNFIMYLHERAAGLACTDLKHLLQAIRHTEMKLLGWQKEKQREEAFGMSAP